MPVELDYIPRPPRRPIPVAAAVMLGLVLGIFGYIVYFAIAFTRPADDIIVFVPLLALLPAAGVLAWLAWPHWRAVAACVALPTAFWSLLTFVAVAGEGKPAAAHLGVATAAIVASLGGALVGRRLATHDRRGAR
jgi:hypothetical protein